MADYTKEDLDGFREAAQSLKKYRRAELSDDSGTNLIGDLYVDPLPNDHVLHTMIKPNTTFLIGRKGTGKSTVFQRSQHELRSKDNVVSAYVDIKTTYESCQVEPALLAKAAQIHAGALPEDELRRLLLHHAFLVAVVKEIQVEMENRFKGSLLERIKGAFSGSIPELFDDLDELLEASSSDEFINVMGVHSVERRNQDSSRLAGSSSTHVSLGISPTGPSVEVGAEDSEEWSLDHEKSREFSDLFLRVFNIREYILQLKGLLARVGIKHLYVFIDDFSELPREAMSMFVDTLLAPLNNWSDELVKFKVAAYPGRIYYGEIDKTKIDEVNLDTFALYGSSDVAAMEEKAADFTRRLVERRVQHFCRKDSAAFFDARGEDGIWRELFFATMANPRNLGYLLYFAYETNLAYDKAINVSAIRDAARRYYDDKIEAYFEMNRFLHESFTERSSIYSLRELLEQVVEKARSLRHHQGSAVFRDLKGRPPTSHFHVALEFDSLLTTLELNFFITKYYVMKDRDGRRVAVYALNYGLCQKNQIVFGRPHEKREQRLYFVERLFDYTAILQEYVQTNQEIACNNCGATFDNAQLPSLRLYGMSCPSCRVGTCSVTNLSRKYEPMLRKISDEQLLPTTELGILHTLGTEKRAMKAAEIASELDCSYQLIGKRGRSLDERGLVKRDRGEQNRRTFEITVLARDIYIQPSDDHWSVEDGQD